MKKVLGYVGWVLWYFAIFWGIGPLLLSAITITMAPYWVWVVAFHAALVAGAIGYSIVILIVFKIPMMLMKWIKE